MVGNDLAGIAVQIGARVAALAGPGVARSPDERSDIRGLSLEPDTGSISIENSSAWAALFA